jgi:peroxiredoxin
VNFPLLSDPAASVIRAFGVAMKGEHMAVPAVYVVAGDGTIAWRALDAIASRTGAATIARQLDRARRGDGSD